MRYLFLQSVILLKSPFSRYSRRKRLQVFSDEMKIQGEERIIDLGGAAGFWENVEPSLEVTIVNLPGELSKTETPSQHKLIFLEADACHLDQYPYRSKLGAA
jgi:hypothetical protein